MNQPPPPVLDLIQRFDRNREAYRSPHYNETQLRCEFLDSFFKALGWDIDNKEGCAEAYNDVVHENAETPQEKTALERQITATEAQLDRLVYDLYGLTEAEMKIVEGAAA